MFAIVVTMLLSDKELGGSNWLAAAADPRPDQLPTPGDTSRNTYVGVLMNKRAVLYCQQNFHYLKNREQCISGLMRPLNDSS